MLRQEVYALDGTPNEPHPYTVIEQNFTVERLQPQEPNRHAVFFTHARETLAYHYERDPSDPRIAHTLTLEVDPYGNILAVARRRLRPEDVAAADAVGPRAADDRAVDLHGELVHESRRPARRAPHATFRRDPRRSS